MYWLDGSSKLPFVPRCSYLLSSSRAKKFALAQDLIENQARIVKSLVKIGDFDHWCHAASELVDLVLDLVRRDEKYLRQDGLSTRDESLCRISDLNSQFVNFVNVSTFELARKRLSPSSQSSGHVSIVNSVSTPIASCNDTSLRDGPNRGALKAKFSSAQPPPTTRRAATTTTSYLNQRPAPPPNDTVTHALPRYTLSRSITTTTTSHSHNQQPNGCPPPRARTPWKEVDRKEKKERDERKEVRREGVEKEERRGEKGEEKQKQGRKPPTPPPLTNRHEREPPRPRKH